MWQYWCHVTDRVTMITRVREWCAKWWAGEQWSTRTRRRDGVVYGALRPLPPPLGSLLTQDTIYSYKTASQIIYFILLHNGDVASNPDMTVPCDLHSWILIVALLRKKSEYLFKLSTEISNGWILIVGVLLERWIKLGFGCSISALSHRYPKEIREYLLIWRPYWMVLFDVQFSTECV